MSLRLAAALAAAVAGAGCASYQHAPQPRPQEGEWAHARDATTRRAFLYDGFTHRATATATYLSPAVREARARRLAEWLDWTPKELQDRLAQERAEAEAGEEFLLAFFTAKWPENDLDAPRTVWRVAVKVGNEDLLATRITGIPSDVTTVGLFPYVGPFDVAYRVILPHSPSGPIAGRPFVLELASAHGKVVLDFGATPILPIATPWEPVPAP